MLGRKYYVDPPAGWKYGFPKIYEPKHGETMEEWLVDNGYPESEVEFGARWLRMWEAPSDSKS
jgi:hypothetical protein